MVRTDTGNRPCNTVLEGVNGQTTRKRRLEQSQKSRRSQKEDKMLGGDSVAISHSERFESFKGRGGRGAAGQTRARSKALKRRKRTKRETPEKKLRISKGPLRPALASEAHFQNLCKDRPKNYLWSTAVANENRDGTRGKN